MNSEMQEVVDATAQLVHRAREHAPGYGKHVWGCSSNYMAKVYRAENTLLHMRRFESEAKGMAFQIAQERYLIVVDNNCPRSDLLFTQFHELAHVMAGEAVVATFLTSDDCLSFSERRADLFAIVGITPTAWLERYVVEQARTWQRRTWLLAQSYRELTRDWSELRVMDRARLRMELFRAHGI